MKSTYGDVEKSGINGKTTKRDGILKWKFQNHDKQKESKRGVTRK